MLIATKSGRRSAEELKNAATVRTLGKRSGVALCLHGINKKYCKYCLESKKPSGARKGTKAARSGSDSETETGAE
jgi:hypothetical protein